MTVKVETMIRTVAERTGEEVYYRLIENADPQIATLLIYGNWESIPEADGVTDIGVLLKDDYGDRICFAWKEVDNE